MRALQISTWHQEAQLVEVDEPTPGPGQVVVKIGAAGACHSDLHMMHGTGDTVPFSLPFTLGHENAGWVHSVGTGVTSVEPGQPVAVYGAWGCGSCLRCSVGMENYCEAPNAPFVGAGGGLGLNGGMADYMLVPDARYLIPLPEGLTPVDAAPLTDAGVTPYHAVRRSLQKLGPTVDCARHRSRRPWTPCNSDSESDLIGEGDCPRHEVSMRSTLRFRSARTRRSRPATTRCRDVRAATGKRGADLVLDCVGTDATIALGGCVHPVDWGTSRSSESQGAPWRSVF